MADPEKGLGLILALMILLILSLLAAAMLSATAVDIRIGDNYRTAIQLVYLAQAGIEDGRETLRQYPPPAEAADFAVIENRALVDATGRVAGHYSVSLVRSDPLTLKSVGTIGESRKTIEVLLRRSGFPSPAAAITLNEELPLENGNVDPQLATPAGVERLVEGIARNATDVYSPSWDSTANLGPIGSAQDYRVVVVHGNCTFGNADGHGILLVRGDLIVTGNFSWNGLILVLGQGVFRSLGDTSGWISGAVVLTRTRENDRSSSNPLGTLRDQRGEVTLALPADSVAIEKSDAEVERANRRFPYVPTTYREY